MPAKALPMNGTDKQSYGALITIRERETGQVQVLRTRGKAFIANVAERIDALDGEWRVICMSTPDTIYRDLQGTRKGEWQDYVHFPELTAFGQINRLDLLDEDCFKTNLPRGRTHA